MLALVGIVVVVVCGRVASVSWTGSSHFFSRDAEDAVQTQPENVPKLLSFTVLPLKFLKLWLETRHRRHY